MWKHLDPSGYRRLQAKQTPFLAPLLCAGRLSGDRPFLNLVRQLFGVSLFPVVALAAVTEIKTFQSTGRVSLGLPRAERMISGAFRQLLKPPSAAIHRALPACRVAFFSSSMDPRFVFLYSITFPFQTQPALNPSDRRLLDRCPLSAAYKKRGSIKPSVFLCKRRSASFFHKKRTQTTV